MYIMMYVVGVEVVDMINLLQIGIARHVHIVHVQMQYVVLMPDVVDVYHVVMLIVNVCVEYHDVC